MDVGSRSDVALLYNDRAVQENHHVSATYRLLTNNDSDIFCHLSRDDWRSVSMETHPKTTQT